MGGAPMVTCPDNLKAVTPVNGAGSGLFLLAGEFGRQADASGRRQDVEGWSGATRWSKTTAMVRPVAIRMMDSTITSSVSRRVGAWARKPISKLSVDTG